jgi:hypothetical protein
MRLRSNSATPDTVSIRRPCGLVVSGPWFAKALKASACFADDQVDDPQRVEGRQAIQLGHDQHIVDLERVEHVLQFRAPGGHAGRLLSEDALDAGGPGQLPLRRERLIAPARQLAPFFEPATKSEYARRPPCPGDGN